MKQRVYIIHGWDDAPHNGWFPWLKKELESLGAEVHLPSMPEPERPQIDIWVSFLRHLVGEPDARTYFIGHSIGCQTILRYLETVPAGVTVGGVVLVAGWVRLKPEALEDEEAAAVAIPWLQRPLDWPKIRSHLDRVAAIMSDDDQFVPIEDGKIFAQELGAQIVTEHHQRHLGGEDGVMMLVSARQTLQSMMEKNGRPAP